MIASKCFVNLLAAVACALLLPAARADLTGFWSGRIVFAPAAPQELTLRRNGATWSASAGGVDVSGRVRVSADGTTAFWIQPATPGLGQAYASPVALHCAGKNACRGTARPLEDKFTLELRIWRDPDGSMMAAFRNPEQNAIGRTTQFRVEQDGDTLHFTAQPDVRIDATVSGDGIAVHWPPIDRTIELTRRSVPTVAKYVYRKPPGTGDGWTTARAKDAGMDEAALERIVQRLLDSDPFARRPVLVHSLLIARRGKLVLEEYFHGHGRDEPHDLRSAGKTFASVMLGAAMHRGTHVAPDTGIYDILAGMGPFANPDPRKSQITLAQLMTHTSGLACDDNDDASPGNENAMQSQSKQPDWWKYTLDLPLVHDPGTRYAYCSGGMNLVAAALTTATHTWLPEYFERTIAGPLGFGPHYWNLMPDGEGYLGGGAYVRPRDLLKVGQLYLDGGVWRGKRIVARSWVTQSTQPRVHISPATTGMTPEQFSNSYIEADDAYAWHLSALHDYAASGNGGQLLIVVPDYDLVVVFTAGNYGQGGIWTKFRSEIVPREILPAIRKRPSSAFGTFSPLRGAKEDR